MKHLLWISLLVLITAGCGAAQTVTPVPTVSLDEISPVSTGRVTASGEVMTVWELQPSFVISGMVKDVTVEAGDEVQAGQTLAVLETTELEYSVKEAEIAVRAAELEAKIQRYRRKEFNPDKGKFVYLSGPPEVREIADIQLVQAQAALDSAKANLAQGILVAPRAGTVITVDVAPGEFVQPGQPLFLMTDLNELQIETTDLSERDIAVVQVGQLATVYIEALDSEFSGTVTEIAPQAETLGGDKVFRVTIQLNEKPADLLWGMTADVEIQVK